MWITDLVSRKEEGFDPPVDRHRAGEQGNTLIVDRIPGDVEPFDAFVDLSAPVSGVRKHEGSGHMGKGHLKGIAEATDAVFANHIPLHIQGEDRCVLLPAPGEHTEYERPDT